MIKIKDLDATVREIVYNLSALFSFFFKVKVYFHINVFRMMVSQLCFTVLSLVHFNKSRIKRIRDTIRTHENKKQEIS